jgi:hypothetical protein
MESKTEKSISAPKAKHFQRGVELISGGKPMICDRCSETMKSGEEREHFGQNLCEDCYMDALSPARTCDPWAVHSARSLAKSKGGALQLNETQKKILMILKETGGAEPATITDKLEIKPADLEREAAALRHMEKIRGELRNGKKFLILW